MGIARTADGFLAAASYETRDTAHDTLERVLGAVDALAGRVGTVIGGQAQGPKTSGEQGPAPKKGPPPA